MPPSKAHSGENCERLICNLICGTYFTKKVDFGTKKMKKIFQNILESFFGNIVYNVKKHVCAEYGHHSIKVAMDMPILVNETVSKPRLKPRTLPGR